MYQVVCNLIKCIILITFHNCLMKLALVSVKLHSRNVKITLRDVSEVLCVVSSGKHLFPAK